MLLQDMRGKLGERRRCHEKKIQALLASFKVHWMSCCAMEKKFRGWHIPRFLSRTVRVVGLQCYDLSQALGGIKEERKACCVWDGQRRTESHSVWEPLNSFDNKLKKHGGGCSSLYLFLPVMTEMFWYLVCQMKKNISQITEKKSDSTFKAH